MDTKFCTLGGRGVNIGLDNYGDHGGRVYWNSRCNSYVVVKNDKGKFSFRGVKCDLININGIGEIRWYVQSYGLGCLDAGDQEAFDGFGLAFVEG